MQFRIRQSQRPAIFRKASIFSPLSCCQDAKSKTIGIFIDEFSGPTINFFTKCKTTLSLSVILTVKLFSCIATNFFSLLFVILFFAFLITNTKDVFFLLFKTFFLLSLFRTYPLTLFCSQQSGFREKIMIVFSYFFLF